LIAPTVPPKRPPGAGRPYPLGVSKPIGPDERRAGTFSSVDDVLALVRARGGRATSSRRILLEVLFHSDDHLTAEELAEAVQQRAPDVHISTIYRNVEDLQRLGVVVHSHLGHGAATFQLASLAHAHFICEGCGAMIEAPEDMFRGLARAAKTRLGFSIDPRHFAILGRCAACEAAGTTATKSAS
jgi:Fur family ferric uptake transcriptional regulator